VAQIIMPLLRDGPEIARTEGAGTP
jgi:hypothetical protein